MAKQVTAGAMLKCSFGAAPATFIVLPANNTTVEKPAANIMDHKPTVNIPPFGMCSSLSNPAVASATSAAFGVLTPMPCLPVTPSPWAPGASDIFIAHQPALNDSSKCACNWGGVIEITAPGQVSTTIP